MFSSSFTSLLTTMVSNYDIIFLAEHNQPWAKQLYDLIYIGAKAKNLDIVRQIIDSINELQATLKETVRQEQDNGNGIV